MNDVHQGSPTKVHTGTNKLSDLRTSRPSCARAFAQALQQLPEYAGAAGPARSDRTCFAVHLQKRLGLHIGLVSTHVLPLEGMVMGPP